MTDIGIKYKTSYLFSLFFLCQHSATEETTDPVVIILVIKTRNLLLLLLLLSSILVSKLYLQENKNNHQCYGMLLNLHTNTVESLAIKALHHD